MFIVWIGFLLFWAFRWLVGLTVVAGFLLLVGVNFLIAVRRLVRDETIIAVPLIGGVAGALACFFLPYDGLAAWWWAPFIVDMGSAPMLLSLSLSGIAKLTASRGRLPWTF